jgi:hypothetical protein
VLGDQAESRPAHQSAVAERALECVLLHARLMVMVGGQQPGHALAFKVVTVFAPSSTAGDLGDKPYRGVGEWTVDLGTDADQRVDCASAWRSLSATDIAACPVQFLSSIAVEFIQRHDGRAAGALNRPITHRRLGPAVSGLRLPRRDGRRTVLPTRAWTITAIGGSLRRNVWNLPFYRPGNHGSLVTGNDTTTRKAVELI